MANIKSAAKRAKQAEIRRQHNVALRSRMRTAVKKANKAISDALNGGDLAKAAQALRDSAATVDAMVVKGLIHRNKAARHKSRQSKALKKAGGKGPVAGAAKPSTKAGPKKTKSKKVSAKA